MVVPAAAVYHRPHELLESVTEALGWPRGRERAMEIGRPVRTHIVEPLEDPVPRESPTEPVPEPTREAPPAAPTP